MKSDNLFVKCKVCAVVIAKTAKTCPKCGGKQKRFRTFFYWLGISLLGLVVIAFLNNLDEKTTKTPKDSSPASALEDSDSLTVVSSPTLQPSVQSVKPNDEIQFIELVTTYVNKFGETKNELQQSILRDKRKQEISRILTSHEVTSWVGKIRSLETNTEGKAILVIRLSPDIELGTWNNGLSDVFDNTLIDKETTLYKQLSDLTTGKLVKFSGSFFRSETDYVREKSITIQGSMTKPEFLFKFSSVQPID